MVADLLVKRGLKCPSLGVLLAIVLISIPVTGCGTLRNSRGWGQDAIYPVNLSRVPRAAYNALFDVQTLIPAAGAVVFGATHLDKKVSNWASEHNPIFGSKHNADKASDYLLIPLYAESLLTALVTPSGDDSKNWAYWKMKGIAVEGLALGATIGTTALLKEATNRTRPDESDDKSFPSSHSSTAFSSATLSNRNLNAISMPEEVRLPLQLGNIVVSTFTAWARVEAQKHYPSDVLAGAALGYFLTAFIDDAFLGLPEDMRFGIVVIPLKGGAKAEMSFRF
jgi:membrane-associated phospholipid phosphatase